MTHAVATEIANQIGNMTFTMLGAQNLVGSETGLTFKIRGSKKVSHVKVELDEGSDLYNMTFLKIRGVQPVKTVAEHEGIYSDMMHSIIEDETGLFTRL